MKKMSLILVALLGSGCYATHEVARQDCLDGCSLIASECSSLVEDGSFTLEECQNSCDSTTTSVGLLYPECAECFVTDAQCQPLYIREFCLEECGF